MLPAHVTFQMARLSECMVTLVSNVLFLFGVMVLDVTIQSIGVIEAGQAVFALVKCIFFVDALMFGEIALQFECCTAFFALELTFSFTVLL